LINPNVSQNMSSNFDAVLLREKPWLVLI